MTRFVLRRVALPLAAVVAAMALSPAAAAPVPLPPDAFLPGRLTDEGPSASTATATPGDALRVEAAAVGHRAIEPTLGADANGRLFYAAASLQQLPSGVERLQTRVLRSDDDGATWTSVEPRLSAAGADTAIPPATSDPYVHVDPDTGRVFSVDLQFPACSVVSFTDDAGDAWTQVPLGCGQPANDHQSVVTAPPPAGVTTAGYPNVVYYCFNRVLDSSCSRSLDGGRTFLPAGAPAFLGYEPGGGGEYEGLCGGLHGHVAADAQGRLYMPKGHCGTPYLAVSEDGGLTWTRTAVSDAIPTARGYLTEHLSVAVDDAGTVYFTWWDDRHLPWLAVSRDHGRTFEQPMMVAPPGVAEVNFPVVTAGAAGHIAIHFPGTTDARQDNERRPWNSYIVMSTNADEPAPVFLAAMANDPADPVHRGDCTGRCAGMYDFLDIVVSPQDGRLWAAAVDTCTEVRDCNAVPNVGAAVDNQGFVIRQVAGPRLR